MKQVICQGIVTISIFLILVVFLVIRIHAEEQQCIDISGTWAVTAEIDASNCGGTKRIENSTDELIQIGCIVTSKDEENNKSEVKGDRIYLPDRSIPGNQVGSKVILQDRVAQVSGNKQTGKSNWTWTDGRNSCSGTTEWTAIKLSSKDIESVSIVPSTLQRDLLKTDELFADTYQGNGPVHNDYFMPFKDAGPAIHKFSRRLSMSSTKMTHRIIGASGNVGSFPALQINFFTYKDHLVPVERNKLLKGKDSIWNIILAPGLIWSEPGDNGYSRASFPFTLVPSQYISSQTHNGIATFLFNDEHISALRFQIVQEAAPNEKFDAWGQASMMYIPSPLQNQKGLTQQFAKELLYLTPIRSWTELEYKYDPVMLDKIDETSNRGNITLSGLIIDDVVYARPCRTRWGDYPFCAQMRHSVYSISKSLGAMVAMLRLAQKYGDGVFDLKIKDYIDIASNHDGWNNVTFGNALSMTTGIGNVEQRKVSTYVGENSTVLARKIDEAQTIKEKLKLIAAFRNYPWGPGEVFRYRNSDTFILAVSMDRYIKSREGPNADLWDLLTREVFQPIGIEHMPVLKTRERNHKRGIPPLDVGMLPNLDEVAKLAKLLNNDGQHKGEQILSTKKLNEAIGKTMLPGLPTGWQMDDGEAYYNMSLWLHPFKAKNGCLLTIPAMSGYGGSYLIIMPNGITAFRFADGRESSSGTYDSSGLRKVADYIRPFCENQGQN